MKSKKNTKKYILSTALYKYIIYYINIKRTNLVVL